MARNLTEIEIIKIAMQKKNFSDAYELLSKNGLQKASSLTSKQF